MQRITTTEFINDDNTITTSILSLSTATKRPTNISSMINSIIQFSDQNKKRNLFTDQSKQSIDNNEDKNMLLLLGKNQTNNNSHRLKSGIQIKQKKTTFRKNSRKHLIKKSKKQPLKSKARQQKIMNTKHLTRSNTNKQKPFRIKKQSHNSIIKQKRKNIPNYPSRQQQHKLKAKKIDKKKLTRNRKKSMMTLHQKSNKIQKSRANSPIQTIRQQRSSSPPKSSITIPSRLQSKQEPKNKQHVFEKRDRTTSLMALQILAKKIAIYKAKYGNIETRHSSLLTLVKSHKVPTQRKK
ncbi:unnamed protein product [Rotaria sordida]|uniref:Uncharacterized protein n=1 Tax=Rotaria sordida TaxID=392033 RepID=A0A815CCX3_9BILA|nr:unnamed protein product [Rotaria sordida]CAF1285536.1 unnamed protein product [Rotaria sordida]CAF3684464.1 unnamed protein product [Rotaria sordida]